MWIYACSELAWRLANLAAIPWEITANCKSVVDNGMPRKNKRAYSEEHPTLDENHLTDGVRLICEATIFTFQIFQGYGHIFSCIFECLEQMDVRE